MNARDFIAGWDAVTKRELVRATEAGVPEIVEDLRLVRAMPALLDDPLFPDDAARFLIEAGLPGNCAPFLSFDAVGRGPLPLVGYYGLHHFSDADASRLVSYHVLGSDGSGNPLCLDSARGGEIVILHHEDRFVTRCFVASGVDTLAEALLILHTHPHEEFVERLRVVDPPAAAVSSFLPNEVSMLAK